jgi:hypothetical protein
VPSEGDGADAICDPMVVLQVACLRQSGQGSTGGFRVSSQDAISVPAPFGR